MAKYIDADKMADELSKVPWYERDDEKQAIRMVKEFPAADVVSRGVLEQVMWERDLAISQLAEIGKGFGEKMDDVQEVRHGRWKRNNNGTYSCNLCQSWIPAEQHYYARYCLYCGAKMVEPQESEDKE